MKLEYRPMERPGRSLRRLTIAASICLVGFSVLVSREGVANRQVVSHLDSGSATARTAPAIRPDVAMAEAVAYEKAIQSAAADPLEIPAAGEWPTVRQADDHPEAATPTAGIERRVLTISGVVDSSMFDAGTKAGLSVRTVMDLVELFRYDIDFALDLRDGDRFTVVQEELYKDGQKWRDGDMLAAEFINQGNVHRAVRFIDSDGHAAFYTPDGESLRKAFFRTPLDVIRISSPFDLHRRHPILNTIRAHKGVDYAAPTGTPIKATGDGKVEFVGMKGGYGRVIELQHGDQYETVYAHMSKFRPGIGVGDRVKQGQVIGYVGESGLATAPHLHYEFHVNGVEKNPVNLALPRANPIPRAQLATFRTRIAPLVASIESANSGRLAQASAGGASVRNAH